MYTSIDDVVKDAARIAIDGASNPVAVAGALRDMIAFVRDTGRPFDHIAVRAVYGHLGYLLGVGLGPSDRDMALLSEMESAVLREPS